MATWSLSRKNRTVTILGDYYLQLGDTDQGCEGVVRPAPVGAGRMMLSKPERSEDFDVIIRSATEGAGRTKPEKLGHYPHYNTKLTISREIAQIQYQDLLLLLRLAAILFTFLLPFPQVNPPQSVQKSAFHTLWSDFRTTSYPVERCWNYRKLVLGALCNGIHDRWKITFKTFQQFIN